MTTTLPAARRSDPVTSHEAADSIRHIRSASCQVVLFLLDGTPLADHELVAEFERYLGSYPIKYSAQRLRTARNELTRDGSVTDTGIYRLTPSGRRAKVWQIA